MAKDEKKKETEKILTVNLSTAWKKPRWNRAKEAIKTLEKFLKKRTKVENVKISKSLNEKLWNKGIGNPPRKIRIRIVKLDEKTVKAELIE